MSDKVLIVLQGPAGTKLFPDRAVAEVAGMPYLELQLARLQAVRRLADATIVVATSDQGVDDGAAELAERLGTPVVRGLAADPLGQFSMAFARHAPDHVVRVSGHSPLIDPFVITAALDLHRQANADYTSNTLPRSYPAGLEVEVMSARALRSAELEATDPEDRFHVTSYVYRRPHRFRLANLSSGHDLAAEDWRVEAPPDLERARRILGAINDPVDASWNRIISVAGRSNKPQPGQVTLRPLENSAPGSSPWVRTWSVEVDGQPLGRASVGATLGRADRRVDVPDPWLEPARAALYQLLLDDQQTRRDR